MKAYRIITYVYDLNGYGLDTILEEVQRSRHIHISTGAISEIDIGEWDDDHPLNYRSTDVEAYFNERLK